ncbi:MAG: hypothetical protein EOM73_02940 [Bacteroidia bacterium]|nr:hypothetical protein [Bacteroidia bacterium]
MKKLILIFALVAAYGVSMANAPAKFFNTEKSQIMLVAVSDDGLNVQFTDKDKKKETKKAVETKACCAEKSETTGKATVEAEAPGCSEAQKKKCAEAGKTCGGEQAKKEKK